MAHSSAGVPSDQLGANGSASLQRLLRLGFSDFSLISTAPTLPDLFSSLVKIIEAVLEPYFTFTELLVI